VPAHIEAGPHTLVDMHLLVDPRLTVSAAHSAGQRVRAELMEQFPNTTEVLVNVHAEPAMKEGEEQAAMRPQEEIVEDVASALEESCPLIRRIAHVRCHYLNGSTTLEVEIVVDDDISVLSARKIAQQAQQALLRIHDVSGADVHLELGVSHCRWAVEDCCEGLPMELPQKLVKRAA